MKTRRVAFLLALALAVFTSAAVAQGATVPENGSIFTITNVAIKELEPLQFSSVTLVDGAGETIALQGDVDAWFDNAKVVSGDAAEGDFTVMLVIGEFGTTHFEMAEDCRMNFVFSVEGKTCEIPIGPGVQLVLEETENGYALLGEETSALPQATKEPS